MDAKITIIVPRGSQLRNCTVDTCPASDSVYGYLPSKPVNFMFLGLFVIAFFIHLWRGIRWKSWTFLFALGVGSAAEAVGYIGRLRLHSDPFSKSSIGTQLVALTIAPAFLAGGIYLTLKHLVIIFGVRFFRIGPQWYTRIFISCDIASILVQSLGAGIDSGGSHVDLGNDIMMVGIVSQVVTLAIFGAMSIDVFRKVRRIGPQSPESTALRSSTRFKYFLGATTVAFLAILIRCIYRIAEMAGGWRNSIMQNQVLFIIFDGVMCLIAVFALAICHPGFMLHESRIIVKGNSMALSSSARS